jgi:hypothetical protein
METNTVTENVPVSPAAPVNAVIAMHGVTLEDIPAIVRTNASRKSSNGHTFQTSKSKVSLLTACIMEVRSKLGLPEFAADGQTKIRIGEDYVMAIRQAIDELLRSEANNILTDAAQIGAKVTIRRNYLAPSVNLDKGTVVVNLKSSLVTAKEQAMNSLNYLQGLRNVRSQAEIAIKRLEQDGSKMKDGAQQLALLGKAQRRLAIVTGKLAEIERNQVKQ